jgi:hypothetical protein
MQTDLFGGPEPSLPHGFRYQPDVVTPDMQAEALAALTDPPSKPSTSTALKVNAALSRSAGDMISAAKD